MHRLKSVTTIYRFRFAALLLCARCLLFPAAVGVMLASLVTCHKLLATTGVGLALLALLCTIAQWFLARRTGCPLCLVPVLAGKRCVPHRHARPLLGSYRLRVALAILFKNSFHCPYCHEPTAMQVRDSRD